MLRPRAWKISAETCRIWGTKAAPASLFPAIDIIIRSNNIFWYNLTNLRIQPEKMGCQGGKRGHNNRGIEEDDNIFK
jgi:hypothetical protein